MGNVYRHEYELLSRCENLLESDVCREELLSEFETLTKKYKSLLRKTEKITKISDSLQNRLIAEQEKTDQLLLNTLPAKVVDDLKKFGKTWPDNFRDVTVYLSDIVGFTKLSSRIEPRYLIDELNEIFTAFDDIMEHNRCERIKTIGDAYMAVCGMPEPNPDHTKNIIQAAVEIMKYMKERYADRSPKWEIRIGIHTGQVVGGIVGVKKYIYDIFGDTINTASRMEANSLPMRINVSEPAYLLAKEIFSFQEREELEVKGKGMMKMYFLDF
ncbi:MAG: adenylate/guanylate cyclase domain-containing protein [Bacteroidetes bacterium]|nr:adenylate/guanylate cyclase domain-containing protein [Bacteroidota bacterium]